MAVILSNNWELSLTRKEIQEEKSKKKILEWAFYRNGLQ